MKRRLNDCSVWVVGFVLALLFASSGCGVRVTGPALPPATCFSSTVGNGIIFLIQGYDGLPIMICSDGGNMSSGVSGRGTSNPPVQKSEGYAASQDGRRLDWLIEKRNGQRTTCRLNNKEFDLQKGTLFLVRTKEGETKIDQLAQDLSDVSPNIESFSAFAKKNSAVSTLLEIVEEEKAGE